MMSSTMLLQFALLTYIVSAFSQYQYLLVEVGDNENGNLSNTISNEDLIPSSNNGLNSINHQTLTNKLGNIAFRKDLNKPTKKPAPNHGIST